MGFIDFIMKKHAAAALNSVLALISKSSDRYQKEGTLKTYCNFENYLLEMYKSEDIIAETDA